MLGIRLTFDKNKLFPFISIFFFSALLRFYFLPKIATFGHDNSRDMILIYKLIEYKEWIYRGPVFSIVWADLSPIYYYIIALPYWILRFNPLAPAIFSSLVNLSALILIIYVMFRIYDKKSALISGFIYGFSFMIIKEGAFGLNPALIPPFAILYYYFLTRLKDRKAMDWILFALCNAMIISFHPSGYFILPVTLIGIIFIHPRISKGIYFKSFGVFFVAGLLPYLIQEKKVAGWNIKKWIEYVGKNNGEKSLSVTSYAGNYFTVVSNNLRETFVPGHSIIGLTLAVGILISIVWTVYKGYQTKKGEYEVLLSFILLAYIIVFGFGVKFTDTGMHDSWFQTILIPWIVMFLGYFLGKTFESKYKLLVYVFISLFFIINIGRMFSYVPRKDTYLSQKLMVETIKNDAKGESFDIVGTDPQPLYYMLWFFENDAEKKDKYLSWIKWPKNNNSDQVYYIEEKFLLTKNVFDGLSKSYNFETGQELTNIFGRKVYHFR